MRDLTRGQYIAALRRHGMTPGLMGYVRVNQSTLVWSGNAGTNSSYRAKLSYLIREKERIESIVK